MNIAEIQIRLDAMPARMCSKGLRSPGAQFQLSGNCAARGWLLHTPRMESRYAGAIPEYQWFREGDAAQVLDAMDEWISALPGIEDVRRDEFLKALAGVIELGRENGIDADLVNPLMATMKRLSENAITDQRKAA